MTADTDAGTISETVSSVLAEYPVVVGFLFGSWGRGDADDDSDVDAAVAFETSDTPRTVSVNIAGTAPIERVDVVKNNTD